MTAVLGPPAGSMSPASSPRLPSPPPFPEVQIGPKSPVPGAMGSSAIQDIEEATMLDNGATRRIRPGTKAADMASGPPLVPLSELDSPFQLQEHLKALYFNATKSEQNNTTIPISRETALMLAAAPDNVDRSLWLYELCRFLVQKVNNLIVGFFSDSPPCSALNCPEMRASEWQYLCAVHDPPKSCCAIDYCCHTLDWAANILASQKHFPSRLTLGSESAGGNQQSVRHLTNVFRRVYRMFAHAWFQHRDVFWAVESHEGLYIFYKTVCDVYNLIPEDNYTVPKEAEGMEGDQDHEPRREEPPQDRTALGPTIRPTGVVNDDDKDSTPIEEGDGVVTISTGATTRRHKHTPSVGSFVTTIAESDEEIEEPKPTEPNTDQPTTIEDLKRRETMEKIPPAPPPPPTTTELSDSSPTPSTPITDGTEDSVPEVPLEKAQPASAEESEDGKAEELKGGDERSKKEVETPSPVPATKTDGDESQHSHVSKTEGAETQVESS